MGSAPAKVWQRPDVALANGSGLDAGTAGGLADTPVNRAPQQQGTPRKSENCPVNDSIDGASE
jgi:hypothetical protein